jgi:hypothetical protein
MRPTRGPWCPTLSLSTVSEMDTVESLLSTSAPAASESQDCISNDDSSDESAPEWTPRDYKMPQGNFVGTEDGAALKFMRQPLQPVSMQIECVPAVKMHGIPCIGAADKRERKAPVVPRLPQMFNVFTPRSPPRRVRIAEKENVGHVELGPRSCADPAFPTECSSHGMQAEEGDDHFFSSSEVAHPQTLRQTPGRGELCSAQIQACNQRGSETLPCGVPCGLPCPSPRIQSARSPIINSARREVAEAQVELLARAAELRRRERRLKRLEQQVDKENTPAAANTPRTPASGSGLRRRSTPAGRCKTGGFTPTGISSNEFSASQSVPPGIPLEALPNAAQKTNDAYPPWDLRTPRETRAKRSGVNPEDGHARRISKREIRMERRLRRRAESLNMMLIVVAGSICVVGITALSVALALRH